MGLFYVFWAPLINMTFSPPHFPQNICGLKESDFSCQCPVFHVSLSTEKMGISDEMVYIFVSVLFFLCVFPPCWTEVTTCDVGPNQKLVLILCGQLSHIRKYIEQLCQTQKCCHIRNNIETTVPDTKILPHLRTTMPDTKMLSHIEKMNMLWDMICC